MVDFSSIGTRTEEMDTVQIGDVDTPIGAHRTVQSHSLIHSQIKAQ